MGPCETAQHRPRKLGGLCCVFPTLCGVLKPGGDLRPPASLLGGRDVPGITSSFFGKVANREAPLIKDMQYIP